MKIVSFRWKGRRRIVSTILSFGGIQAAQIFLPLLALPYLARILKADAFGMIMYWNVVPIIVGFVLDWGFLLGGVREIASHRDDADRLSVVWSNGLLAKFLLAISVISLSCLLLPIVPHAKESPSAFFWAIGAGVARGVNPLWFLQGLGDGSIRRLALWDVGSSTVLLLLTFALVHEPQDGERYLALLALCKGGAYLWLITGICRQYYQKPSIKAACRLLWQTRIFFWGGIAGQLYGSVAQLALGGVLPARDMGFFLAADKIVRAMVSLSNPLTQTLFPEICALHGDHNTRIRIQQLTLGACLLLSTCAGAGLYVLAPVVMQIALGKSYIESVWVLQSLAVVVPLLSLNMILGPQILVPHGKEITLALAQVVAALISVPSALFLAYHYGLAGAISLPIIAEGSIFLIVLTQVIRTCPCIFSKCSDRASNKTSGRE